MQQTSQTWKTLWASGTARLEARAIIDSATYAGVAPVVTRALMQSGPQIGNAAAASCALSLRGVASSAVPRSARIVLQQRLTDGTATSEWLPAGAFYVSRRSWDPVAGVLTLEGYDALLKADAVWEPSSGDWPRAMADVAEELAELLGLELDTRTEIPTGDEYLLDEPEAGATIRDALSAIAQRCGGNWTVTPADALRLVPFAPETPDAATVAAVLGGVDVGEAAAVSGIRCATEEGEPILVGDDTGLVLDAALPAVQAVDLLERLEGAAYRPFALDSAVCDPACELGDAVSYGGEPLGVVAAQTALLGLAFRVGLSAPAPAELADEYPYIGGAARALTAARAYVRQAVEAMDNSLTQEEIFKRLTDNGAAQGLVLYNGQLYVNASYIRSGTLVLGGSNDQHGTLQVLDASGNEIGTWSRRGIVVGQNGAVRCAVYHDFGPEQRYDFVSQRNGMVAMLDQGKVTVFDGSLASAVITATNKASLSPTQLSIDADDPGEAASALLKGWATIIDAATGLDKVVHSQSELTSGGLTLENEDDGQWFGLDRDALRYSGEVQLETPLGMEYGGTGGYFNVGPIAGADVAAGKSLMEMGLISKSGFYVMVLALVTSSTQDASSAYALRYTGSNLYIIGKLHEGTANGAPLLSTSGVISRKDGGTIATTYNLKYVSIYIPN